MDPTLIRQKSMVKFVKKKDLDKLEKLGGAVGVAKAFNTDPHRGISDDEEEIAKRRKEFGSNTYKETSLRGFFHFVWQSLEDFTIFSDLVSMIAAAILFAAASVVGYFGSGTLDKVSQVSDSIEIKVLRGGDEKRISMFEIVVGDVVCLKIGDQVPADGLFLESKGHSLRVKQSNMTEKMNDDEEDAAAATEVSDQNPFLFYGTQVVDGHGRMIVTSVGKNSRWCRNKRQNNPAGSGEQPVLESRLHKLMTSSPIRRVGLPTGFIVFTVLLIRFFAGNTKDQFGYEEVVDNKITLNVILSSSVLEFVGGVVTIVVVAIPEGLKSAISLALSFSKRMMADMEIMNNLSACATMVGTTTICTNKTGTLTMNQMKVAEFYVGKDAVKEGANSSFSEVASNVIELLGEGIALNTIRRSVTRPTFRMEYGISSCPMTERAILSWAADELNMDVEEVRRSCTILHVEAFRSEKKRSGVLVRRKGDKTEHVHWKGAAEIILEMCSSYYDTSGMITDLDDNLKLEFQHIIEGMAASSLRCLAFAHNQVPPEDVENSDGRKTLIEKGSVLLGIVGMKDPCRPEAKKAVQDCRHAGVKVKMITGDNVFTAKAIATECGILSPEQQDMEEAVIEGEEFRKYSLKKRMKKVDEICVMARSSPEDKLLMVQALQQRGDVVAVTGNSTNDVLALIEADIGISVGIQSNETAKKISDIVVLDDNFASVATLLKWSRCIYNNIQKFIQFQLTYNIAVLAINSIAGVSIGEIPLNSGHILWLNLILNTLGSLALSTEKPTNKILEMEPVDLTEPLISNIMLRNIFGQVLFQIVATLILLFKAKPILGFRDLNKSLYSEDYINAMTEYFTKERNTLIFNAFLLCQVFNEFNARNLEEKDVFKGILSRDKWFLGIIVITISIQVILLQFLYEAGGFVRLKLWQWGLCFGIAFISWPIGWFFKCIPVPVKPVLSREASSVFYE